jgi:hypothetical protein
MKKETDNEHDHKGAALIGFSASAPHGLADTHKDQLNADLLAFLKT